MKPNPLPRGALNPLRKMTGKSRQYLSDVIAGRVQVGNKMGRYLEKRTGIPAAVWAYGTVEERRRAVLELSK